MPIIANKPQNGNGNFVKSNMPAGLHSVVIVKVEDLGQQPVHPLTLQKNREERQKKGQDPNSVPTTKPIVRLSFKNQAGQVIAKEYTLSSHEKATLRKDLTNITGKDPGEGFDVEQFIGTKAQAMVVEKASRSTGNKYTVIATLVAANPVTSTTGVSIYDNDIPF